MTSKKQCTINLISICVLLALAGSSFAWSATPHMIMYAIARKDILPNVWNRMQQIFDYMPEKDVNFTNWYELVCWADDIKNAHLKAQEGWHFYDQPFYDGIDPENATFVLNKAYSVVNTLNQSIEYFKKSDNGVMFHKSFLLRNFIHFMGDMHQPLHCATRVTKKLPDGDRGGNLFLIKHHEKNLHALWDTMMGKIKNVNRPLKADGINAIENWASTIRKEFPREKFTEELKVKDVWEMAKKIFEIAVNETYKEIVENEVPSEKYIAFRFQTCKKLIALAGYRLADFLNELIK